MTRTFDLQIIEERYLGQSIEEFLANNGDPREYARLVFAGEVFPHEDPAAPELGIETEADLVEALEALARVKGGELGEGWDEPYAHRDPGNARPARTARKAKGER